mgnify:FL=1
MKKLGELILNHYQYFLGDYIASDPYSDNTHQVQLMGFKDVIEDCLLFATFGMSGYAEEIKNCCEVVLATECDYDKCAEIFMNAIFYILENKMNFGKGVLIEGINNIDAEFSKKYNKTALYFTNIYILPEEFAIINNQCKIYMAFFVSEKEAQYIKEVKNLRMYLNKIILMS